MYPNPPNPDQDQSGPQPTIPQIDEEMQRRAGNGGKLPGPLLIIVMISSVIAILLFLFNVASYLR